MHQQHHLSVSTLHPSTKQISEKLNKCIWVTSWIKCTISPMAYISEDSGHRRGQGNRSTKYRQKKLSGCIFLFLSKCRRKTLFPRNNQKNEQWYAARKISAKKLGQEFSQLDNWHIVVMIFLPKVLKFCSECLFLSYFPKLFQTKNLGILRGGLKYLKYSLVLFFIVLLCFVFKGIYVASFNHHLFVNS